MNPGLEAAIAGMALTFAASMFIAMFLSAFATDFAFHGDE